MAGVRCREHGCSITPRDDRYGGYCYKHRSSYAGYSSMSPTAVLGEEFLARLYLPPKRTMVRSEARISRDIISRSTGLEPNVVTGIVVQNKRVIAAGKDLTIPNEAYQRKNAARDLMDSLSDGVDPSRMRIVTLSGLNVMTMDGVKRSASLQTHEVLGIRSQSGSTVLVDPVISQFAPVSDRSRPVEDQLESGVTPFGDKPWVGPPTDYVDGSFIWWNDSDL